MDESILDGDQVENLIKFCPVKEEIELLKVKLAPNVTLFFLFILLYLSVFSHRRISVLCR